MTLYEDGQSVVDSPRPLSLLAASVPETVPEQFAVHLLINHITMFTFEVILSQCHERHLPER
jgi:hypothetical protein